MTNKLLATVPFSIDLNGRPDLRIQSGPFTVIRDPIRDSETLVSMARANRRLPASSQWHEPRHGHGHCDFCAMFSERGIDSVRSVDNKRPFAEFHKILFVRDHLPRLSPGEMSSLYREAQRLAQVERNRVGDLMDGVCYGMNRGEYQLTGTTQEHPHSQMTGLGPDSFNAGDRITDLCKAWQEHHGRDYLADYEFVLRSCVPLPNGDDTFGNLIVAENADAILYVPLSQQFRGEMQVAVKHAGQSHILAISSQALLSMAELEATAFQIYRELGIENVTTLTFASRFSVPADSTQRFIVSLCPRVSVLAFSELLGRFVIDELPWTCAARFRHILSELERPNHRLVPQ